VQRRAIAALLSGACIGLMVVVSSVSGVPANWIDSQHTYCQLGSQPLSNATVWLPVSIVAAPFGGFEEGRTTVWSTSPAGGARISETTGVQSGNLSAYLVFFANISLYAQTNVSLSGHGPGQACLSSIIGIPSPDPPQDTHTGLTTFWSVDNSSPESDVALSSTLNASQLCQQVENDTSSTCALSSSFDLNFERATGDVDTCGQSNETVLHVRADSWPVGLSVLLGEKNVTIPIDEAGVPSPHYANGSEDWYNYTFPPNFGSWQIDNLSETSDTGTGDVFEYAPCPP
jgi:hypothetical protein